MHSCKAEPHVNSPTSSTVGSDQDSLSQVNWEFWTNSNDQCGAICNAQKEFIKARPACTMPRCMQHGRGCLQGELRLCMLCCTVPACTSTICLSRPD